MSEISKLTELRKLMLEMERAMGLQELSAVERDVYYAVADLSGPAAGAKTTSLLDHALVSEVSRPTFFRALKSLVGKGYIAQCNTSSRGRYRIKQAE